MPAETRSPAALLRRSLLPVGLLVSALFAYLAVRKADPAQVWSALRQAQPVWLLGALVFLAATVLARSERWRSLFAAARRPTTKATLAATLIGYLFNSILPARAGEAARVLDLTRRSRVSRVEAVATVVVERIFDVAALLFLLFVLAPWYPSVGWFRTAVLLALVLGACLLGVVVALVRFGDRGLERALRPLQRLPFLGPERIGLAAQSLGDGLAGLRRPGVAAAALAWTTGSWLLLAVEAWFVLRCFHLGLSPLAGLLLVIAWNLAAILPSSPAGLGVFEAAVVAALSAYDVPRSQALSVALVLHAVNILPLLIVGPFVLARRP